MISNNLKSLNTFNFRLVGFQRNHRVHIYYLESTLFKETKQVAWKVLIVQRTDFDYLILKERLRRHHDAAAVVDTPKHNLAGAISLEVKRH